MGFTAHQPIWVIPYQIHLYDQYTTPQDGCVTINKGQLTKIPTQYGNIKSGFKILANRFTSFTSQMMKFCRHQQYQIKFSCLEQYTIVVLYDLNQCSQLKRVSQSKSPDMLFIEEDLLDVKFTSVKNKCGKFLASI